jgi:hypothetical protein
MPKISTYNTVTPTVNDKLIGTDTDENNKTKNFTIADIIALFPGGSKSVQSLNSLVGALQLIAGNNINITLNVPNDIVISLTEELNNISSIGISTESGQEWVLKSDLTDEIFISVSPDNEVALHYNNDKKCETTSYGFRVGGDLRVTGFLDLFQQNDNTFAGTNAGNLDSTNGNSNTGFGENVMSVITTASQNTGVGLNSLKDNTSGNSNTAVGAEALTLNIAGSNNVAIGRDSTSSAEGGAGNTAVGAESLKSKQTTNFNTAIGFKSLLNLFTGFRNTALGNLAGSTITTGSRNITIGDDAQPKTPTTNGEITLGDTNQSSFRIPAIQQGIADGSKLEYEASSDTLILKETQTLIPEFITATPGGSTVVTTSKNIIDLTWAGGSGTFDLILPSAAAIPYRVLRVVNDSTVTASDKVHVVASSGQTIDGAAFYEISKPYNGCAIWSDGSEWIVIQAK